MTEIRCHYTACDSNVGRRCIKAEIFISGNVACHDARNTKQSKEDLEWGETIR